MELAVLIFNPSGVKLKQAGFRAQNFVRQILPHPDGRKLLELHDKVQWIELGWQESAIGEKIRASFSCS